MIIFSIGSLTMVTSIIRLTLMPPLIANLDMSWALATPATWICIEGNLVIICGCLPILRLFCRHVCPRLIGEYGNTSGSARPGGSNRPDNGSAELSNLEKKSRIRSQHYAKMNDMTQGDTLVDQDDGSDKYIIEHGAKGGNVMVDTIEVIPQERERSDSAAFEEVEMSPKPYSQICRAELPS